MSAEKDPDSSFLRYFERVLRVVDEGAWVVHLRDCPSEVVVLSIFEESWVPIEIQRLKMLYHGLHIHPKRPRLGSAMIGESVSEAVRPAVS